MSSPHDRPAPEEADPWGRFRGALKDIFAEFGGGEAYLRAERSGLQDRTDLSSQKSAG